MAVRHLEAPADELVDHDGYEIHGHHETYNEHDLGRWPPRPQRAPYNTDPGIPAPHSGEHRLREARTPEPDLYDEAEPLDDPELDEPVQCATHQEYVVAYVKWLAEEIDWTVTVWMARYAVRMLQLAIGSIFFWFGALKFIPGMSPAEPLVAETVNELFGLVGLSIPARLAILGLAFFEVALGLGFLLDRYRRAMVWLLLLHMASTALPLVLLPTVVWTVFPHALTLEGQYIFKNLVIVAGAAAVGATIHGGYLTATNPYDNPGYRTDPASSEVEPGYPVDDYPAPRPAGSDQQGSPTVWIVNEDGSLVATYELEDYYPNDGARWPDRR